MSGATYSQSSNYEAGAGGGAAPAGPSTGAAGGAWGRVLVAASACVLTVSIVGSAAFLAFRIHERRQLRERVQTFIASLENRTEAELAERAEALREKPKLAQYVLPELRRALRAWKSESQLCAVIRLSEAFVDQEGIEAALFELRGDRREVVAGAAVDALTRIQPVERAAQILGECLVGAKSGETAPAAVDSACAGLFRLGASGRSEIEKRLDKLSVDRRRWLVRLVDDTGGPYRESWLRLLAGDKDANVRAAAERALSPPAASRTALSPGGLVEPDSPAGDSAPAADGLPARDAPPVDDAGDERGADSAGDEAAAGA